MGPASKELQRTESACPVCSVRKSAASENAPLFLLSYLLHCAFQPSLGLKKKRRMKKNDQL